MWQVFSPRGGREFVRHVIPAVLKPARTLWNEIIGFFFLCLAVVFGFNTFRTYLNFARDGDSGLFVKMIMAGFCCLLMLYFGISSFLRARRISRS